MAERTSYAPGTFSWVELASPDATATKDFYGGLFGWTFQDFPVEPDSVYTMFFKNDRPVAACYEQGSEPGSAPPSWLSYITVNSADETAKLAEARGGNMLQAPFDVTDVGRMALVSDPSGAVFALWEPRRHAGAGLVNEPGTLCWNELRTADPGSVVPFYKALFDWDADAEDMGDGLAYTTISVGSQRNGGIMPADGPAQWQVYFAVEDADDTVARAVELGGEVTSPPMDMPYGRIATLSDSGGASFSIYAGQLDP